MTTVKKATKKPKATTTANKRNIRQKPKAKIATKTVVKKISVKPNIKLAPKKTSFDQNTPYQVLGVILGVVLTILLVLSVYSTLQVSKIKTIQTDLKQLQQDVDLAYISLDRFPQLSPRMDIPKPDSSERMKGDSENRYMWIIYSDIQCPYCAMTHASLVDFQENSSDNVSIVYRHLPFDQLHPGSTQLAELSECVAKEKGEDAFWEFLEIAYQKANTDSMDSFVNEQTEDSDVRDCLEKGEVSAKVTEDIEDAKAVDFNSTPTHVIYDMNTGRTQAMAGGMSASDMKEILDSFVKESEKVDNK